MTNEINIHDLPGDLTVRQLMQVVRAQGKELRITIESKSTVKMRRPKLEILPEGEES